MLNKIKGFHIEPTNICVLKCPRCSRTEFHEKFPRKWKNHGINLGDFKNFFDIDLTGKLFDLRGNYGDPIYYDQLPDMVSWLKSKGARIELATNGSYQTQEWWDNLVSHFDENDLVIFGIDGSPDNFTQYRINGDWKTIEVGIRSAVKSKAKTSWRYIPFSFNLDTIDSTRKLSSDLGIDTFFVTPSDRWIDDSDPLKPKTTEFVVDVKALGLSQWKEDKSKVEIHPHCKMLNDEHYISADGYYMPCCYFGNWRYRYSSMFYKQREKYDISKTTLTTILTDPETVEFFNSINNVKHTACLFNCNQPKILYE